MAVLAPKMAVTLAKHVYLVMGGATVDELRKLDVRSAGLIETEFEFGSSQSFGGRSGPLFFRRQSGFGYILRGHGTRAGEVVVATRGTVTARDWLTDFTIGLERGPGGLAVHSGFNGTFRSFFDDLDGYFARNDVTHVHCVGHSLGGALATLVADHVSSRSIAAASLYTFGSPRVGADAFARSLSERLGPENQFRVHHDADPVGMVPLVPFWHVPYAARGVPLRWNGSMISVPAHYKENYVQAIGDAGWRQLICVPEDRLGSDDDIGRWLAAGTVERVGLGSKIGLKMIGRALAWILKQVANALSLTVTAALTVAGSALDVLAYVLHQGVLASQRIADSVQGLIRRIFEFLGRVVPAGANLSVAFIRWTIDLLLGFLGALVRTALER